MKYFYLKQKIHKEWTSNRLFFKTIVFMKIQAICLLFSLQASAHISAQYVSLQEKNVSITAVLEKITNQTGVFFWYDNSLIEKSNAVNISCKKISIEKVLAEICINQNFTFEKINEKVYTLKKKEIPPINTVSAITENLPPPPVIVKGKVTDEKGNPLAGASIIIKGKGGAQTNENGEFTINVPADVVSLQISYIGYENVTVNVKNKTYVSVTLKAISIQGEELVVVGYSRQKKTTVTGAVEQVSSKTFESRAVSNVALALQGATPGLVVTRSTPRPGNEKINMVIRGLTSVNGSSPLVVIDGVPALNGYEFLNMNSDDIENISILKDASAAIYGSAAAGGVILVTTKRAKAGKIKVDYTGNIRFNTNGIIGYSPSMQQYATEWLLANQEETVPNWWVWQSKDVLQKMQSGFQGAYPLFNIDYYIFNANRIKEMFTTQLSQQHNISLAGGDEKSRYRLSVGFADNRGNLATAYDGQKQYNARFNYDYKLSNKLKLETGISLVNSLISSPSVGLDNTLYGYDMPFFPAKNPYGQWFACFNGVDGGANRNAAAMTTDGGRSNNNSMTIRLDVKATYQIYKDLALETVVSFQNERDNQERWVVPVPVYNWYGVQTGIGNNTGGTNNVFYDYAFSSFYQYYLTTLRYNKIIKGVHNISAVAGIEANKYNDKNIWANRVGFTNLGVQNINLASSANQTNGGGESLNGKYSYLGRVNYTYAEKYLLELVGRIDGNSRFAEGYKFKNFGGVSAGWIFTKEDFLQSISNIVNFGKVRLSYGMTGNAAGNLGNFDYLSTVNVGTAVLGQTPSQQTTAGLNANGLISYTRTWEKVIKKDVGIDLKFLKSRLSATFDYYINDNIGMLINVNYPSVLG